MISPWFEDELEGLAALRDLAKPWLDQQAPYPDGTSLSACAIAADILCSGR